MALGSTDRLQSNLSNIGISHARNIASIGSALSPLAQASGEIGEKLAIKSEKDKLNKLVSQMYSIPDTKKSGESTLSKDDQNKNLAIKQSIKEEEDKFSTLVKNKEDQVINAGLAPEIKKASALLKDRNTTADSIKKMDPSQRELFMKTPTYNDFLAKGAKIREYADQGLIDKKDGIFVAKKSAVNGEKLDQIASKANTDLMEAESKKNKRISDLTSQILTGSQKDVKLDKKEYRQKQIDFLRHWAQDNPNSASLAAGLMSRLSDNNYKYADAERLENQKQKNRIDLAIKKAELSKDKSENKDSTKVDVAKSAVSGDIDKQYLAPIRELSDKMNKKERKEFARLLEAEDETFLGMPITTDQESIVDALDELNRLFGTSYTYIKK